MRNMFLLLRAVQIEWHVVLGILGISVGRVEGTTLDNASQVYLVFDLLGLTGES